jgi:hypothetical protein
MNIRLAQSLTTESANGALYTSMGRSPMKDREEESRAESPTDRTTPAHPLDIWLCSMCAGANCIIIFP